MVSPMMEVYIIQSFDHNRKQIGIKSGLLKQNLQNLTYAINRIVTFYDE